MKKNQQDIRWHQRVVNFNQSLKILTEAIHLSEKRELSALEKQGLIQSFEYNYELAWNCIKDFYQSQGETEIQGSRDAFRLAFNRGLIDDGKGWMEMIKSRILTSHTYNEATADDIAEQIIINYYPKFIALNQTLNLIKQNET